MLKSRFFRFAMVGAGGFVVDAGVLLAVNDMLGPYWGRLLSFALAVVFTWILNRHFTFGHTSKPQKIHREFGQYFMAMIVGGSANYITYAGLVYFVTLVAQWPVIGVGIGSIIGLAINYSLAKSWIFKPRS
ncbi:MAG: GtrA family protein [Devosiaceae bacterium]|nr:GtrA family protein [Devosiaceae bacterium]